MYPTETISPGPEKALSFRQNPAVFGTGTEEFTSGREGTLCGLLHPDSVELMVLSSIIYQLLQNVAYATIALC